MNKNKSSRVHSNLLQQNCFVRDVSICKDLSDAVQPSTYVSVDEKISNDGVKLEFNSYPYPITPDYVNSFVDSSDYRRDPAAAVANGVKRTNLGDISKINEVLSMSTDSQAALYKQLSAKFSQTTLSNNDSGEVK